VTRKNSLLHLGLVFDLPIVKIAPFALIFLPQDEA